VASELQRSRYVPLPIANDDLTMIPPMICDPNLTCKESPLLTITGSNSPRFCDGLSHRNLLRIGALGGALTLADMRRLQAQH